VHYSKLYLRRAGESKLTVALKQTILPGISDFISANSPASTGSQTFFRQGGIMLLRTDNRQPFSKG